MTTRNGCASSGALRTVGHMRSWQQFDPLAGVVAPAAPPPMVETAEH